MSDAIQHNQADDVQHCCAALRAELEKFADEAEKDAAEILALRAENDAMRPIVEAACAWRSHGEHADSGYHETANLDISRNMGDALTWAQSCERLAFAVDAYRSAGGEDRNA